jgi:hypothetical protein
VGQGLRLSNRTNAKWNNRETPRVISQLILISYSLLLFLRNRRNAIPMGESVLPRYETI